MNSFTVAVLVWSLALSQGISAPSAGPLRIAAASDLQTALPGVVERFERDARADVTVSFGSSGNLFAQIQNGAPYDVYLSADIDYPKQLVASGHADASSLYQYATGRLVLWTRKDSGIDIRSGLRGLTDSRVAHIAIANPKYAPYGRAAEAALRQAKVYDAVRGKLVFAENISQTAQLVDSGNASVGIIALSLAIAPALSSRGTYIEIPASAHPPIDQAAVVINASKHQALAREFLTYLKRTDITQHLHRFGFSAAPPGR
jgi:molybdate transport system substrate-binding protein